MAADRMSSAPGTGWGDLRVAGWGIAAIGAYLVSFTVYIGQELWSTFPSCVVPGVVATRVSPTHVLTAGGEQLRVFGEGFANGMTVQFGSAPGVAASVLSPFELTVQTPKQQAGWTPVTLNSPELPPVEVPGGLNYVAKRVTALRSVSPQYLLTTGDEELRIIGDYFRSGVRVRFGPASGEVIVPAELITPTEIVARSPKLPSGTVSLSVLQGDDAPVMFAGGVHFVETRPQAAPPSALQITTVEPASAGVGGGVAVTITGNGFTPGTLVRFGGLPARAVQLDGSRVITAVTPMHPAGPVSIVVANDQAMSSLEGRFSFVCPTIPDNTMVWMVLFAGALGGLVHALRSFVWYAGQRELVWSWVPMYALLPFSAGALGFVFYLIIRAGLYQPGGGTSFLLVGLAALVGMFSTQAADKLKKVAEGIFTESPPGKNHSPAQGTGAGAAPTITNLKPLSGPLVGGNVVTISGTGFAMQSTIRFGQTVSPSVTFVNSNTLRAVAPKGAAGVVDVGVTVPGKAEVVKAAGYIYLAPQGTLTTIDPPDGPIAGATPVTLTGTQFTKDVVVTFGDIAATVVDVPDAQTVKVTTPKQTSAGAVEVRVVAGPNLIAVALNGFTYK